MERKTQSAGGVVRNSKGEIALTRQEGWYWSLPKGHVEEGEEIIDAARREIAEEVGITQLELKDEFKPYTRPKTGEEDDPDREVKTIHMFLFDTHQEKISSTDPRHDEGRWVPIDDVAALLSNARDKEFFLGIKDSLK